MLNRNPILVNDSYKYSQFNQYPEATTEIYSYVESRGGISDRILFFGLQAYIKEYLMRPFTKHDIDEAEALLIPHGEPFYREGYEYILNKHGGYFPVLIRAINEGTIVPTHVPVATMENTDPTCAWVTSPLETSFLRGIWYPSTVATISWMARQIIYKYLKETCDDPDLQIDFKLHDFGARGVSSGESAALGGMGHLVNFLGTDTVEALMAARQYYNAGIVGFSIPAMEHSTVTSWGRNGEVDAFGNMILKNGKPGGLVACVSDSYDLWNAVDNIWGRMLKQMVLNSGATIVVRPDSGDPATVIVETIRKLATAYGSAFNKKGYRVLHPSIRVIQGDGITIDSIPVILEAVKQAGFSTENLAMGMGGGLLQHVNRDTFKWAMKCSSATINGKQVDVYKDPVTDPGKASKKGKFAVAVYNGRPTCYNVGHNVAANMLLPVYCNGELSWEDTFENIRSRAKSQNEW